MSLARTIRSWAASQPDRVAIHADNGETTWRRLANRIDRATARLQAEWNVTPGARVAYLGLNRAEEIILFVALGRLGAILVPLNTRLASTELAYMLRDCGAQCLISDNAFSTEANKLAVELAIAHFDLDALIAEPCAARATLPEYDGEAPALLVYTSGTTGAPKGVVHTMDAMLWNAMASIAAHDLTSHDHVLTVLPLFHVGGLCIQTLPALCAGATLTMHARFDAQRWIEEIAARRISISLLVPATMRAIVHHPRWPDADLSSLRLLMAGSSTIPSALIESFHARDVPVGQIYGATETGPVSVVLRAEDARSHIGLAGWPALHTEVRLIGADGSPVAAGEVGEIEVRSRNLMQGYWARDGEIDRSAIRDGWFATGDLARADESGCIEVVGRSRDMIISGGENIYPAEIENILSAVDGIAEAAVVGVADPTWGEVPLAAVVAHAGFALTEAGVLSELEGRLARFKHPRAVVILESLPKNAMGKVQKAELAKQIAAPI